MAKPLNALDMVGDGHKPLLFWFITWLFLIMPIHRCKVTITLSLNVTLTATLKVTISVSYTTVFSEPRETVFSEPREEKESPVAVSVEFKVGKNVCAPSSSPQFLLRAQANVGYQCIGFKKMNTRSPVKYSQSPNHIDRGMLSRWLSC